MDASELPEYCLKPTLILGCGNVLFGDDGFGCELATFLQFYGVPEDVCVLDVGTGVRKILFTLCLSPQRPRRIIVLDAFDVGREPGEVFDLSASAIPSVKIDDFSLHHLPTSNLLRDLEESCEMEVRVVGCQTSPLPDQIAPGMSEAVQLAIPHAAALIIKRYLGHPAWQETPEVAELTSARRERYSC